MTVNTIILFFVLMFTLWNVDAGQDCDCENNCVEIKNPIKTMKVRAVI